MSRPPGDITRREYDRSLETLKLFQNSVEAQLRENAARSEGIYNDPRIFAPMGLKVPPRFDEFQLFQLQQALASFRAGQDYLESVYLFFPNGQYVFADTSGGGRYAFIFRQHPDWKELNRGGRRTGILDCKPGHPEPPRSPAAHRHGLLRTRAQEHLQQHLLRGRVSWR